MDWPTEEVLEHDVVMLAQLPSLIHLYLRILRAPKEKIIILGDGFPALKHFKVLCCRVSYLIFEEREYSILLVMSELSTVQCDRALGLWIVGTRASSVDGELPWRCCGRWTVWDGGEGQPGPELVPGDSCGVHSWIEGASGDGRRVSWFAPQNQGGGRRLKTPSRGGTGVGRRLGPSEG